jgi:phosphatidylinositol alpha-1,6-mannosyltransferase
VHLNNSSPVSLLASELYSTHGGVQAYMRRLAEILSEYNHGRGSRLDCISLMDTVPVQGRHERSVSYGVFAGARRSKARFTRQAIAVSRRRKSRVAVIGHPGLTPVAWLLKRAGLTRSYLVVLHGVEAWEKMDWTDRLAIRGADSIVATTRFTAVEFCKQNGIPLTKMRIIPLAIADSDVSCTRIPKSICQEKLRVLTVSRMESIDGYKGVDTLIDAVGKLRKRDVRIELKVVGIGDEVPRLIECVNNMKLNDSVTFAGAVSDNDLTKFYQECDVFALPSKGEGFGIVFLEAMRWGKPCIGGNHGGTPEVIDDGETGYLIEHGDSDQLTRRLADLSKNPELRSRLGASGYEKLRRNYTYQSMRDNWFSLLDEAVSDHVQ